MSANLYVHFPFCRRKCSYCVLYSRVGASADERSAYVERIRGSLTNLEPPERLGTVYFGGGSPALCNLAPLADALSRWTDGGRSPALEFTVELHPLDVTDEKLAELRDLGVNRISMGVQSLDDAVLAHMGRAYTVSDAARAFERIQRHFDNAGIDLIVGYPGETFEQVELLADWGLKHCSVYALQNDRKLPNVPDDETTLDRLNVVGRFLQSMGLARYEISNYALPGYECRHNLAVWRGEDYMGLGDGAAGRIGLKRTLNWGGRHPLTETVTPQRDAIERTIFRLRTREGLDASRFPQWQPTLARFVAEGLLRPAENPPLAHPATYVLTPRGTEVCDTILAELV